MNCRFEIIKPTPQDWYRIESSPDCTCFHIQGWYNYLEQLGRHLMIVKIVADEDEGYFLRGRKYVGDEPF